MSATHIKHKIVIIGGGPAGMAAATAAYKNGISDIAILDREPALGGILRQCIHSGFGLHKLGRELTGPEYAAIYESMVHLPGIRIYSNTTVTSLTPDRVVTARNENGIMKISAEAVILATGCRERSRGALNIGGSRPAGIYSAGTAQRLINREGLCIGKNAVILGSGDIGLIMARRMMLEGANVRAVCELMPYPGGLKRNIVQCLEDFDIPLHLSTTVTQIHGKERLEGVTIAEVDENGRPREGTERMIECDTLLLSVGLIPENELAKEAGIPIDRATGGAVVDETRQTEREGIFACGNALQVHDLVDHVSDEGETAGKSAAEYILGEKKHAEYIKMRAGDGLKYLLPQKIHLTGKEIALYFRVTAPSGRVKINIFSGKIKLASFLRQRTSPGEMEKLILRPDVINAASGELTVCLEAAR